MNNNYAKAYVEVLEVLKYLPKEEYEKIPKEKIQFFKDNCDTSYNFKFDISKPLNEQNFLRETNAIIVTLFRDYFANSTQQEKLKRILLNNEEKHQEEMRKKYNPNNIFKKQETNVQEESTELVEFEEKNTLQEIFNKVINWIKNLIKK